MCNALCGINSILTTKNYVRSLKREEQEENLWKGFGCYGLTSHCFGADPNRVEIAPKAYTAYVWYSCCFSERLAWYTNAKIAPSGPMKDKVKKLIEEIVISLKREWEALEWSRPDISRAFKKFLYKYQEGALIVLSLIHGRFTEIEGCDPVDVWECIATLAGFMD